MLGVYKIKNKVNGKVYIGQSVDIEKRWLHHKAQLRHGKHPNKHLQNAWLKYGEENFEWTVLLELKHEAQLNPMEHYYISKYDSTDVRKGYNTELGGNQKGSMPEEVRVKISESNKGKPKHNNARGAVCSVIINETGKSFETIKECADFLGVSVSTISQHISNPIRHKTVKNFTVSKLSREI